MAYLRNAWYMAMWSEALAAGALAPRTMLGEPLVFFRDAEGRARALLDVCPHRHAPLHLGRLLPDGRVRCGYHGLEFDASGQCVRNPHGRGLIPPGCAVRRYPVVERHSIVWAWMGEREPDPDLIPEYAFLDEDSGHDVTTRDSITMRASWRLLADNLLDLSHVPFLHDGLLGNATLIQAESRIEQRGPYMYISRDKFGVKPSALLDMLYREDGAPVDVWQTIRWSAPCYLLNDTGAHPPGGRRADGAGMLGAHLITPIDETTTIYHFAAARQGIPLESPERAERIRERLATLRRHAFEQQDEPMIEAQQRVAVEHPSLVTRRVLLETDAGAVRCNRLLDRLIAQEQAQVQAPAREQAPARAPEAAPR